MCRVCLCSCLCESALVVAWNLVLDFQEESSLCFSCRKFHLLVTQPGISKGGKSARDTFVQEWRCMSCSLLCEVFTGGVFSSSGHRGIMFSQGCCYCPQALGAHTHMYDTCMFVLIFLLSYCALMGGETLEKVI